jgi:Trypsin-like serine proteases, typically periplasmic, contain C-terminal PDZ domain
VNRAKESCVMLKAISFDGTEYTGKMGSGFLSIEPGVIVTCAHVICDGPYTVNIELNNGESYAAESVIAMDIEKDIAFIRCSLLSDIPLLELGNTGDLSFNSILTVIGCPNGNRNVVTYGDYRAFQLISEPVLKGENIVTNVHAEHGNSGGPVLDVNGRVIGMFAATNNLHSVSYAVPVETIYGVWLANHEVNEMDMHDFARSRGMEVSDSW